MRYLRYSKLLVNIVLLFIIPSLIAYPQAELPVIIFHESSSLAHNCPPSFGKDIRITSIQNDVMKSQIQSDLFFSYDDILDLVEELEEGDLEERCNLDELERINDFVALLAKHGILPNEIDEESALENDIQELLHSESDFYEHTYSYHHGDEYVLMPAIYYNHGDVVLCKSWFHKKWKQTKHDQITTEN